MAERVINMDYYTERNGLRHKPEKTYDITTDRYCMLFDCCERYFDNIAWKYPEHCPDNGQIICGLDLVKFSTAMTFEIPTLFKADGIVNKPTINYNAFDDEGVYTDNKYDQYALLDLIELIYANALQIKSDYHSYFNHDHLHFFNNSSAKNSFRHEINNAFATTNLLYELGVDGKVVRLVEDSPVEDSLVDEVSQIEEPGLKELLECAISYHLSPDPSRQKDAVEKIWDALERIKTYYDSDKKNGVNLLLDKMTNNADYKKMLDEEFQNLTDIGNKFRIRHHETNKIDIDDIRYYDYLFNRCLSLLGLAIKFID